MHDIDKAYIAGLFDGEACFSIKQRMKKRKPSLKAYPTWDIRIEINMTDQSVIRWVYEVLGCGSFSKKPPGKGQLGKKMQWRWRCSHRDAYYVCCLLWPFAHTKLPKIQQIIEHYATQKLKSKAKVINLEEYKNARETSL
jgi:hypothetical protein